MKNIIHPAPGINYYPIDNETVVHRCKVINKTIVKNAITSLVASKKIKNTQKLEPIEFKEVVGMIRYFYNSEDYFFIEEGVKEYLNDPLYDYTSYLSPLRSVWIPDTWKGINDEQ